MSKQVDNLYTLLSFSKNPFEGYRIRFFSGIFEDIQHIPPKRQCTSGLQLINAVYYK